jgi:hypothetical protein
VRKEELEVGADLTPDEIMFAWRGKKGNGGIPVHTCLWLNANQSIPLGTELKCVCEGTFRICCMLEIQTGKIQNIYGKEKVVQAVQATTA